MAHLPIGEAPETGGYFGRSTSPLECSEELPAESRWLRPAEAEVPSASEHQRESTPSCRLPSLFHGAAEAAKAAVPARAADAVPGKQAAGECALAKASAVAEDEAETRQPQVPKASRPRPARHVRQPRAKINPRFFQEILPSEWAISPRPRSTLSDSFCLPSPRCPHDFLSASTVLREALGDVGEIEDLDEPYFMGKLEESKVDNNWVDGLQCKDDHCLDNEEDLLTATNMVRCASVCSQRATRQLLQDELANMTGKACAGRSTAWRSPRHTGGCARLPAIVPAAMEQRLAQPDQDQNGPTPAEHQDQVLCEQTLLPLQPDVRSAEERKPVLTAPPPPDEQEAVGGRVERGPTRPKVPLYLRMQFQYQAQEQEQLAAAREQRLLGRMSSAARPKAALVPQKRRGSKSAAKKLTRTKSVS